MPKVPCGISGLSKLEPSRTGEHSSFKPPALPLAFQLTLVKGT